MAKYFTHLSQTNQPKNGLQKSARVALENASNRLISNPNEFTGQLGKQIQYLNELYPRCTPLKLRTYSHMDVDGNAMSITLGEHFTVGFHIYRVKEDSSVSST